MFRRRGQAVLRWCFPLDVAGLPLPLLVRSEEATTLYSKAIGPRWTRD